MWITLSETALTTQALKPWCLAKIYSVEAYVVELFEVLSIEGVSSLIAATAVVVALIFNLLTRLVSEATYKTRCHIYKR